MQGKIKIPPPKGINGYVIINNAREKGKTNLSIILLVGVVNGSTIKLRANNSPFLPFNMEVTSNVIL